MFGTTAGTMPITAETTKHTAKMNTEIYNKKMKVLQAALKRVEAILDEFAAGKRDPERWNNTHDLFDRIEERIWRLNDKYIDYLSDNQISYNVGDISVIF